MLQITPLKSDLKGARYDGGYAIHWHGMLGSFRLSCNFQVHLRLSLVKLRSGKSRTAKRAPKSIASPAQTRDRLGI